MVCRRAGAPVRSREGTHSLLFEPVAARGIRNFSKESYPPRHPRRRQPIRREQAGPGQQAEEGFVLMTAVLLVERLASASGCEPDVVLSKLAGCFELKRLHAEALERGISA
jgi:hypothetical protein